MSATISLLLVRCEPWLLAVPTAAVQRALLPADAPSAGPDHRLIDGTAMPALDLRPWLQSTVEPGAVVVVNTPRGALAWVAGRCLHVVQSAAQPTRLPAVAGPGLSCVARAALGVEAERAQDLAPFALWCDPRTMDFAIFPRAPF
jgi:hypothetical protein